MYLGLLFVFLIIRINAEVKLVEDYHEHVGIPLARRIKEMEDMYHARQASGRRMAGGEDAPPNLYPYLGGLVTKIVGTTNFSVCGSTLITANRLVTAAHCWKSRIFQAEQFTVVLGSQFLFTGGTRIDTTNVLLHPQYNDTTMQHDIAMIYLQTYVTFSDTIKPAILPHGDLNNTYEGKWVMAAGYGLKGENAYLSKKSVINHVRLQIIATDQCHKLYHEIGSSHICTNGTGGVGICQGDSGGPLINIEQGQPILVGVTQFLHIYGCERGYPSVFGRVTSYYSFIMDHL